MSSVPPQREMERAFRGRDRSYDGVFFPAVKTTGIFCRPSCPARKPLPRNVQYFGTARDALFAGYRPCKRCRPMDVNGRPPEWVGRLLAEVERSPGARLRDADVRAMAIDPARARRYFKEHYQMTFQAYQRSRRMGCALDEIRRGGDLNGVAYEHGYESSSGFRDAFVKTFKRPPGKSRDADCIVSTVLESPVGPLIAGASSKAVCLLEFADRRTVETQLDVLRERFGRAVVPGTNDHLKKLTGELSQYFDGSLKRFTVRMEYPGTEFQRAVWKRLIRIPHGTTLSYSQLAIDVGRPVAQRAVGRANGDNRIAIVIPCHRVVNKDGKLGGYGGGLWRKQFLLDLESGQARTES